MTERKPHPERSGVWGRCETKTPTAGAVTEFDRKFSHLLLKIQRQKYYEGYKLENKPITLIGVNINRFKRQIDKWVHEKIQIF